MAANFKKNEKQLLAAYNDVLNDKTDTDWAIFGYEGKSNDLKVVETGDGGIEELVDEMNSGKVLYAFLRVTDPNTKLPKNVLVNWSGEGVPSSLRGVYARHTTDVARFFRGAHVTINARSEMDLEEDTILEKVSKASGANFGFHKEKAKPIPEQGPVGSVYKKANPQAEINVKSRDQFWSDQERAEGQRVATEKRQAAETRRREELDRREREAREGATRDQAAKERFRAIDEQKHREQERQKQERDAKEAELQTRLKRREDEVESERRRESDALRRRRVEEHTSISAAVQQKKAGFEQPPAEQPPLPTRPPKRVPPTPVSRPPPEPETQQEYPPEPEEEYPPEPEETYPPEPEETYPPEPEETYPPKPEETYPPEPEQEYPPEPEEEYPPEPEQPMYDDVQQSLPQEELAPEEPEQPLYDDVQEAREPPPAEPYYESTSGYDPQVDEPEPDQPMYDDVQEVAGGRGGGEEGGGPAEEGLKARTVYDYEATDDTEISFDIDEIITDIEQIDEGWWRGVRELDGSYGLFPANYVELI